MGIELEKDITSEQFKSDLQINQQSEEYDRINL